jgi:hypothetical protein
MKGKVTKKVNKSLDQLTDAIFPPLTKSTQPLSPLKPQSSTSSTTSSTSLPSISTENRFQALGSMDSFLKGASSMEAKMELILATLMEIRDEHRKHHEKIEQLINKVNTLEQENKVIKKELRTVKESANRYELSARSLTVRILGLQVSQEEATANSSDRNKVAVKNAYDRFLKHIFNTAKTKGLIATVPQINTAIAQGFRLSSNAKDKRGNPYPAPLLIKLTDMSFRKAIFICKREALAPLAAEGAVPIIVEDLTSATLNKMKELREDERVDKVWSTEGLIRYTLASDKEKVRKFPGAFTPVNEVIK